MAAIKCDRCARYSFEEGCKLEHGNYFKFRDCMTGRRSYWISVNRISRNGANAQDASIGRQSDGRCEP